MRDPETRSEQRRLARKKSAHARYLAYKAQLAENRDPRSIRHYENMLEVEEARRPRAWTGIRIDPGSGLTKAQVDNLRAAGQLEATR